jgi:hypothetical protein
MVVLLVDELRAGVAATLAAISSVASQGESGICISMAI